jgi:arsenite methyltransferase
MKDSKDKIHALVKEKYSGIAMGNADSCAPSCCGGSPSLVNIIDLGKALDYAEKDLSLAPGEANLGLGCGNPISKAELKPEEIVLGIEKNKNFNLSREEIDRVKMAVKDTCAINYVSKR